MPHGLRVCWIARQTSDLQDGVRFLGGLLKHNMSLECAGSHASPRSSKTRFDSWLGHLTMTLEPDGTATGCNPVEVGSTPTGVSDCPTAGSDYILKM